MSAETVRVEDASAGYLANAEGQEVPAGYKRTELGVIPGDWDKGVEVVLPGLTEQTAIATILSDMDAEIAALEQRRDKTRQIKQGMMQQLLTGRVRLV